MSDDVAPEVKLRVEMVRLVVDEKVSKAEAARRLGRSREWVHKWLRRYEAGDWAGLVDASRAPVVRPTELSDATVARILAVRRDLERHPHANVGALTILSVLERERHVPLPSPRSIERVLTGHGLSRPRRPPRGRRPKNLLPLPDVAGQPGVYQQADWIQNRYLKGGMGLPPIRGGLLYAAWSSVSVTVGAFS